jgi:hypothetical protein
MYIYTCLHLADLASPPYEYVDSASHHADSPTVGLCLDKYLAVTIGSQRFLLETYKTSPDCRWWN